MSWFRGGPTASQALVPPKPATASRVRVILLDGLGRADAQALAALNRVCARGHDLVLDVGFPTVSLPVQHVLWTGLTQQQSGVLFSNDRLEPPSTWTFGARTSSVAVAESHGDIVRSFGFGRVLDSETDGFEVTARSALDGDDALAFVHVLGIDEAGHAHGRDSEQYRSAAQRAAALVERWVPTTIASDEVWLWLADHGHTSVGGHGGAEDSIRRVRACVLTGAAIDHPLPAAVRLVDIAASVAAWLGTPLPVASFGTPMHELTAPTQQQLPTPEGWQLLLAGILVASGLLLGHRAGRRASLLPWWFLVGYVSFVAVHGAPSLSLHPVFPRYGASALLATAPGGVVALAAAMLAVRRGSAPTSVFVALLAAPVAVWTAVLIVGGPALIPHWSAHVSVLASLVQSGVAGGALGVLLGTLTGHASR